MSMNDAKAYIDSLDLEIVDNAYKSLHTIKETDSIEISLKSSDGGVGSIITVLDYKVPSFRLSDIPEEMRQFLSKNVTKAKMSDFKNFVNNVLYKYLTGEIYNSLETEEILRNVNTPEKVFLFISELNNPTYKDGRQIDKSVKSEVMELAQSVGRLTKLKHYFVKGKNKKDDIRYLIPIKEEALPEYRKDRRYPIRSVIDAAQQVLAPRLGGVKLNIITNEQAEELSKASERDMSAKAFIMNGEIYVNKDLANAEDLFHEYTHILLGYLKNNKDENIRNMYFKLLEEVWNLGEQDLARDSIERIYSKYAKIDQMEEYFALRFSRWINDNADAKYDIIFSNKALGKEASKLFDPNNYSKSIKELFGSTIETVLLGFNAEIGYYLSKNPTLADEYKDLFTLSRKKTEWIREQIDKGNLQEKNC